MNAPNHPTQHRCIHITHYLHFIFHYSHPAKTFKTPNINVDISTALFLFLNTFPILPFHPHKHISGPIIGQQLCYIQICKKIERKKYTYRKYIAEHTHSLNKDLIRAVMDLCRSFYMWMSEFLQWFWNHSVIYCALSLEWYYVGLFRWLL